MKKVLLMPFLVLFLTCAREAKNVLPSSPITIIDSTATTPKETVVDPVEIRKVKVYIENTLSMYGYLPEKSKVNTKFRDAVNELLIVSKANFKKEKVELFLINNQKSIPVSANNNLDDINVKSLERNYSIGRGSSDFDKLFGEIIPNWKEDEIIVFIADFIYSPGTTDVTSGLNGLRMNITDAFQSALGSEPIAVNILHLESDFVGPYYYDNDNKGVTGIVNRPYYIFILGNERNVSTYSDKVVPKLKRYNLENEYLLTPVVTQISDYSALPFTLNKGQFGSNSFSSGTSQIKAVTVKKSLNEGDHVQLAVSIDLSDVSVSGDYLLDINNYVFSNNKIKLKDIGKIDDKLIELSDGTEVGISPSDISHARNATHVFLLTFPSTYKGDIELALKKNIPQWVEQVSIKDGDDDRDIRTNVTKQSQTFGFNYIVEGVFNAQENASPENEYFRITLDVDQEKSGSGISGVMGWLIGLSIIGIIIFIIIRNKKRK